MGFQRALFASYSFRRWLGLNRCIDKFKFCKRDVFGFAKLHTFQGNDKPCGLVTYVIPVISFGWLLIRNLCLCFVVLMLSARLVTARQKSQDSSEIYVVGGDVKPPKIIHYVEPDPSSQDAYVEGVVRISAVVNLDGTASDMKVLKGLNDEEDKLALAALKQWRFKPGSKSDKAVRVRINVEISFHLL